jgi:hypothetical protein
VTAANDPRPRRGGGASAPAEKRPSTRTLERWESDGGCETTECCWVEPGGTCEHGYPSWLRYLGYI